MINVPHRRKSESKSQINPGIQISLREQPLYINLVQKIFGQDKRYAESRKKQGVREVMTEKAHRYIKKHYCIELREG